MRDKPYKNSQDQILIAKELLEVTGIDLLDGRNIAVSRASYKRACAMRHINRVESKRRDKVLLEEYLARGGKITVLEQVD